MASKRVFLNIICPLFDRNSLLNANYYIADCPEPDRPGDHPVSYFDYNEDGNLVTSEEQVIEQPYGVKSASIFNIQYGNNCLNPGPYITTFLTDNHGNPNIEERWIKELMSYPTMADVQEQLYLTERRGNGILFIIYYKDENIINFGGIVAEYLADNFGEDVTFVDAKYRPYVKGQYLYKGNMVNARKVAKSLNEANTLFGFLNTVTTSCGVESAVSNMTVYLQAYNIQDLIRLYNLLWPDDKLPQAYYTIEQLKEIIIDRMLDSGTVGSQVRQSRLNVIEFDPYNY